jgi:uncharacterized membrane protein YsdA (DUF1294 family)/cold shock CspA family protein
MRLKGKLVKWNEEKAFGFISPTAGGEQVFIHKSALANRNRTPKINEIIAFSIAKDKQGRYCASDATFLGEKVKKKQANKINKFSIYLALIFLTIITFFWFAGYLPTKIIYLYWGLSFLTFLAYANDKVKAQKNAWRTQESTLHFFALLGGWPGAAIAQQTLRHKSQKKAFRNVFWFTVILNCGGLLWLVSKEGEEIMQWLL